MFDLIAQNVIAWDINKLDREAKDFVVKFEDDDKEIVTCNFIVTADSRFNRLRARGDYTKNNMLILRSVEIAPYLSVEDNLEMLRDIILEDLRDKQFTVMEISYKEATV